MSGFSTIDREERVEGLSDKLYDEIVKGKLLTTNKVFYLNQEIFKNRIEPVLNELDINHKNSIQFLIAIPFNLRIKSNLLFHFRVKDGLASFSLRKIDFIEAYFPLNIKNYFPFFQREHTIVEMSFTTSKDIGKSDINEYFDVLIETFNSFIEAYKIFTGESGVNYINNQSVHFLTLYRHINTQNWKIDFWGKMYLNLNIPKKESVMSLDDFDEILKISTNIIENNHPFNLSEELLATANHYASIGLFRESILYCQMNIESFIRNLYNEFLELEGKSKIEIEEIQNNTPFKTLIIREIPKRIGGQWDITKQGTSAYLWYNDAYGIRNRIIHSGLRPKMGDVKRAFEATEEIKRYIFELLFKKDKKYPQITSYLNYRYLENFKK